MTTNENYKLPMLENIKYLASAPLHFSIFGVAPREIIGEQAFRAIKKEVQKRVDHHCEICGRFVPHTSSTGDWIHTHEAYNVDKTNKVYTFSKFIGICKECHYFIHLGFLGVQLDNGSITKEYYDYVIKRGLKILSILNIEKLENDDMDAVYVMEYEGNRYINDYYTKEAGVKYLEGVKIIPYSGSARRLPESLYYKKPQ